MLQHTNPIQCNINNNNNNKIPIKRFNMESGMILGM